MRNFIRKPKYWNVAALALFALSMGACASARAETDLETARAEIIALSDAWVAAENNQDADALNKILDERFVSTFGSGYTIHGRKAYVDFILNATFDPFSVELDTLEFHGDTAVVISILGRSKITWIAQRTPDGWRGIAQAFSPIRNADE